MRIFFLVLFTILFLFALLKELTEQSHSYKQGEPSKKDDRKTILKKIERCLTFEQSCVKWRRSYIASVLIVALFFGFVLNRFPSINECLLSILVVYIVYYSVWTHYSMIEASEAVKWGKINLSKLEKV